MATRTLLPGAAALALAAWAAPVTAQLDATFIGNSHRECVNSSSGFDGSLALRGPGFISSAVDARYVTFRRDGTGSAIGSTLNIGHSATGTGATPAVEFDVECTFQYAPDFTHGSVTISDVHCVSTALNGPAIGQQTEVAAASVVLELYNDTLVSRDTDPEVETLTNLTTGLVTERICHRYSRRILTPLGPPTGD